MFDLDRRENERLAAICREFGVERLELFGSATRPDRFDPHRSDLDFLVQFSLGTKLGPWLTEFFSLRDALQELFGRKVDLIVAGQFRNPYFRAAVDETRTLVYAA